MPLFDMKLIDFSIIEVICVSITSVVTIHLYYYYVVVFSHKGKVVNGCL
jgi:hypothetical protein